ncbi:MAG: PilZ domain-containing protein [Thermodesulfobacteriota bacterium]
MNSTKKRRSKRLPFRKRVKYGKKETSHLGYTLNLSRNGIVIESSKMFPEKTPLIIEVLDKLNNDGPNIITKFLGRVVWSKFGITRTGRMGIEFLTLSKNILNEYESKGYI